MSSKQYVSERMLIAVRNDGERMDVKLSVGFPYKDELFNTWACPVKAEGLFHRLSDLHGVDPSQAFERSRNFLVALLHDFLDKGGNLYLFEGDTAMSKKEVGGFVE